MKAPKEYVDAVAQHLAPLDTDEWRERYRQGDFPRADRCQNVDKRYRWDLFWNLPDVLRYEGPSTHELNSDHIDTMLRSIVSPL